MEILINNELANHDVTSYEALIRRGFEVAARLEELQEPWEVSITFVDNASIQELNRQYRHIDSATDVLSFPQDDEFAPWLELRVLGDIVISLERAMEQAEEYGHSTEREVMFLAVHGFLHLLGYDHEAPEEQAIMRSREEQILRELDLGRD
ncbi:MAG: rRNA maturation RNase YbeY [Firmicutes bacterium]|nr:rRNA maturation RNase YbeY [Bacillota bacterium]